MLAVAEILYNQMRSEAGVHACSFGDPVQSNAQQSLRTCLLFLRSCTIKCAAKLAYMLAVSEICTIKCAAKLAYMLAVSEILYNQMRSKAGLHACCF